MKKVNLLLLVSLSVMIASAQSATLFSEDFDAATTGGDAIFTESSALTGSGTSAYTVAVDGAGKDYQALLTVPTSSSSNANGSASVSTTGLSAANLGTDSFTFSTKFTLDAFTASSATSTLNLGLAAFGSSGNFNGGSHYRLLYTPFSATLAGKLTLVEFGSTGIALQTSTGTLAPTVGLTGTLSLTGSYSGGSLTLSGFLVSGATTLTVGGTDATPLAGTFFGYRTAIATGATNGTITENIDYDDFSITTIPEPSTYAMMVGGLGMFLLAMRRRQTARHLN